MCGLLEYSIHWSHFYQIMRPSGMCNLADVSQGFTGICRFHVHCVKEGCPARVFSTRQLVSSSWLCTGSSDSCCTRIFSPKTSVRAQSSALLPWFIPMWLLSFPLNEVTIERVPLWRCSRHPRSCDFESSGHTTRSCAEVVPVFARSCHSLYRCTLNKMQIVLKSFVPVLFYNLSLII
jgi:hypothetical protein